MLNKLRAALAMVVALLSSGCIFLPSESRYAVGVAKVGDALRIYAPMCEGERVDGIQVYTAEENPANYDEPFITEHWVVEQPVDQKAADGWIKLGADTDFAVVDVEGIHITQWPELFFIRFYQRNRADKFISSTYVAEDLPIPEYSASEDITTMEYYFDNPQDRSGGQLLTPAEIRDVMGCAIQYF